MKTNTIGLDKKLAGHTAKKLNELLANYQQLYQNLRGFHWNIRGEKFFELHLKFEELYTDVNLKIDEIAERILALDGIPYHTFSAYQKNSTIRETSDLSKGEEILKVLVADYKTLLVLERAILKLAFKSGDDGTDTLLTDYITQHEKTIWMLNAALG
ncbi:MAG: DNA starvation/stationary phase protection protein [Bacteroidetes bacterium]|nr:DNA starvation/stationary phase protection protein [Bacteroidota bacterium]